MYMPLYLSPLHYIASYTSLPPSSWLIDRLIYLFCHFWLMRSSIQHPKVGRDLASITTSPERPPGSVHSTYTHHLSHRNMIETYSVTSYRFNVKNRSGSQIAYIYRLKTDSILFPILLVVQRAEFHWSSDIITEVHLFVYVVYFPIDLNYYKCESDWTK